MKGTVDVDERQRGAAITRLPRSTAGTSLFEKSESALPRGSPKVRRDDQSGADDEAGRRGEECSTRWAGSEPHDLALSRRRPAAVAWAVSDPGPIRVRAPGEDASRPRRQASPVWDEGEVLIMRWFRFRSGQRDGEDGAEIHLPGASVVASGWDALAGSGG